MRHATVVVIGAGQAGLSAAYHLKRRGFVGAFEESGAPHTFIVLDANPLPGGAWQHRWDSLTMRTVNSIFDLPGMPKPKVDLDTPSSVAVPAYFASYEQEMDLPILRPVRVTAVVRQDEGVAGSLSIETDEGEWSAQYLINATGTWDNPVLPTYPGAETFLGRMLHTRDFTSLEDFAGQRVVVVGGGISALQHLEEISRVTKTLWYTRREPRWLEGGFDPEITGRDVIAQVTADVEAGRRTRSISTYTGIPDTPYVKAARRRGVLERRPMFTTIEPHGVVEADGSFTSVDTILWATGFRADLKHLDGLDLVGPLGGIPMRGTQVQGEPRIHLIGYGPSQSTVGANRAGRAAVEEVLLALDDEEGRGRT